MKVNDLLNQLFIAITSGITSAAIISTQGKLNFFLFQFFIIFVFVFTFGILASLICHEKRDRRIGVIAILISVLIFIFGIIFDILQSQFF